MRETRIMIVDHDPRSRELISKHIRKAGNHQSVTECGDCLEAMEIIRDSPVDLLFLAVEMPGLTGIEFIRSLTPLPEVILTTAYAKYALEAFDLDVLDYLLKPVSFERFMKAFTKYQLSRTKPSDFIIFERRASEADIIHISEKHRTIRLFIKDICFIEEINGRLTIQSEQQQIQANCTMMELERKLSGQPFIKIHHKCLVSISRIKAIGASYVELDNAVLNIGRNYRSHVFSSLQCAPLLAN